jgi:hypothetical protein
MFQTTNFLIPLQFYLFKFLYYVNLFFASIITFLLQRFNWFYQFLFFYRLEGFESPCNITLVEYSFQLLCFNYLDLVII